MLLSGGAKVPRRCTICDHPDRVQIETLLLEGVTKRDISRRFAVSKDAVARHQAGHISPRLASAKAAQETADEASLLERLRSLNAEVSHVLSRAKNGGDYDLALKAIARAESQILLEAKLVSEESSVKLVVYEMLQLRMTEALLRLKTRFADQPELQREIFRVFIGDEPAGAAAQRQLPN